MSRMFIWNVISSVCIVYAVYSFLHKLIQCHEYIIKYDSARIVLTKRMSLHRIHHLMIQFYPELIHARIVKDGNVITFEVKEVKET